MDRILRLNSRSVLDIAKRLSMLNRTLKYLLILALSFFATEQVLSQCGDSIDLGTWVKEGVPANGVWTAAGGGTSVNQTINGDPTFYVSPDSFINVIIRGDIRVNTAADDDWIGFVFGYLDPDSVSPTNYDFYLFDWKQADQNFSGFFGPEGMCLARINGPITNLAQAFSSKTGPYATILASNYGNTMGWNDFQTYEFAITYTNTRVVIAIDGDTAFDINGCFPPGRFGFYNYSLSDVNYSNFSYRVAAAFNVLTPNVCVHDTAKFIAISDSCVNAAGVPVNNTLVAWDWDFGDGSTSTDTNAVHVYDTAGVYNVSLVVTDYLGCKDTAYSTVEIYEITLDITPADTSICFKDSTDLVASGALTYIWAASAYLSSLTGASVIAQPAVTSVFFVTGTDTNGCENVDSAIVVIIELPDVQIAPSSLEICFGLSDTLEVSGAMTYVWSPNYAISDTTSDVVIIQPEFDTTYVVAGTDTNTTCVNEDTIDVIVFDLPNVQIVTDSDSVCYGLTIDLLATGATSYAWKNIAGLSSYNQAGVLAGPIVNSLYEVFGTDLNSCVDSVDTFITVIPLPIIVVSPVNGGICVGELRELCLPVENSYAWSPLNDLALDGNNNDTVIADPTDTTLYAITATNYFGCISDTLYNLPVTPLPIVSITSQFDTVCTREPNILTASGANSYLWGPPQYVSNLNTSTTTVDIPSTLDIYVTGTGPGGCKSTDTLTVNVYPIPDYSAGGNKVICAGDSVQLIATGGVSYFWSPSIALSDQNIPNPYSKTLTNRNYDVTITDEYGCEFVDGMFILVHKLPIVKVAPQQTICEGESVRIGGNPTGPEGALYKWSPPSSLNSFVTDNPYATPKDSTEYAVTVTDTNGCKKTAIAKVNVLENPVFKLKKKSSYVCAGDTAEVFVTEGLASYDWSPKTAVLTPKASQSLVFPTDSSYFTIVGTGDNGCTTKVQFDLEVKPRPSVKAGPDFELCEGDSALVEGISQAAAVAWTPTEFFLNPDSLSTWAFPLGRTQLILTATDEFGCTNSSELTASAYELPQADAGEDISNCEMSTVYLGGDYTADPSHLITWTPSENLNDPHGSNPYVLDPENVTYYLRVETPEGCVNEDSIVVFSDCYEKVYAPSSFTPNGDLDNDVYYISAHRIKDPHLIIRDRWGHIVFESTDLEIGWEGDGIRKTKPAPIGVYGFTFTYRTEQGRLLDLNGTITLLR
jgi:gliding motility-associated-like protein